MPYYQIIGIGKDTNRKRTKRYKAKDKIAAKLMAECDGTIVEKIEYEKPELATERQITYAKDLGLSFPTDINVNEMSNLISKKVADDRDSPSWFLDYVLNIIPEENGLTITKYVGIENLFSQLIRRYDTENNYRELVKILIYSIINDNGNNNWSKPFNELADTKAVEKIAEKLSENPQVINSIKRYSTRDFVSLGEFIDDEGYVSMGNIKRTNAYLITNNLLKENNLISTKKSDANSNLNNTIRSNNNRVKNNLSQKQGCLGSILLFFFNNYSDNIIECALTGNSKQPLISQRDHFVRVKT